MNLPLMRLLARRAAPLPALLTVAAISALAIAGQPGRGEIVEVSPRFEAVIVSADKLAASTAWIAGLLAAACLAVVFAARIPDRWFRGEGDWLGGTGTSRSSIVRTALAGILLGSAMFSATLGTMIGSLSGAGTGPAAGEAARPQLLELSLVAGPSRSLVLMPGERFEQELPLARESGCKGRVRVTPTLGAAGPTTSARIEVDGASREETVARRTWLEVEASRTENTVSVTNTGSGALAVLGPGPVEAWRPSDAVAGGHLRLAGHGALFIMFLGAIAFGLGAWMGPGIAAALTAALWLGARMGLSSSAAAESLPGGASLVTAIEAVAEGRSPQVLSAGLASAAAGAVLAGFLLARAALNSWGREGRSS